MSTYPQPPEFNPKNSPKASVTVPWVLKQKNVAPLTMLTAYDYSTALYLDQNNIDLILVGDSVGTVVYGEQTTLSVTMDQMLFHVRAVSKAVKRALVIGDLPFMSYQVSVEQAVQNAGRFLKEAGAHAVKLEGGTEFAPTIRAIARAGIPVVAHIGLTPQSFYAQGGYRMHGKTDSERHYLLESAKAVVEAGAFLVVLECVEENLARDISKAIRVPTIGIGSGAFCDGQVLVTPDLLGITAGRVPKFVRPVAELRTQMQQGIQQFIERTHQEYPKELKHTEEGNAECSWH